jgi:hypothetical protein
VALAHAQIATGRLRQSRARSGDVTITQTAPSLIRQQSSSRSGSTIRREFWWSSRVMGSRMTALGFIAACLRQVTAIQPRCSEREP